MKRKTARAIVARNGTFLLMERWRRDTATGQELHYFSIPGGSIEEGETPEAALVREIFEEMGVLVRPERKLVEYTDTQGDHHTYFVCTYLSGEPELRFDSPEFAKGADNRYMPQWVSQERVATLPLHPIFEQMRETLLASGNQK